MMFVGTDGMVPVIDFTPDEWLYVYADTAEAARRFFGTPDNWPVKFDGFGTRGRRWRVLATGLTIS